MEGNQRNMIAPGGRPLAAPVVSGSTEVVKGAAQ